MTYSCNKIQVGISSCLLGEKVRYDGGHKLSLLCNTEFAELFEFVSICPEVGAGLGIPREPVQLVKNDRGIRVVQVSDSSIDRTGMLQRYAKASLSKLSQLSGFILKSRSPSCGIYGVKVHNRVGHIINNEGTGLFVRVLREIFPELPIEEEQRLEDEEIKQNFVASVLAYASDIKQSSPS